MPTLHLDEEVKDRNTPVLAEIVRNKTHFTSRGTSTAASVSPVPAAASATPVTSNNKKSLTLVTFGAYF